MLLLAPSREHKWWKGSLIVLKTVVDDEAEGRIRGELVGIRRDSMTAKADVIRCEEGETPREAIRKHSMDAALLFMGLRYRCRERGGVGGVCHQPH